MFVVGFCLWEMYSLVDFLEEPLFLLRGGGGGTIRMAPNSWDAVVRNLETAPKEQQAVLHRHPHPPSGGKNEKVVATTLAAEGAAKIDGDASAAAAKPSTVESAATGGGSMLLAVPDEPYTEVPSFLTIHHKPSSSESSAQQQQHCLVTAYFPVRSKYDSSKYDKWMTNFLSLQDCMIIYTSTDMVDTMLSHRQHATDGRTVVISMESVHDLPVSKYYAGTAADAAQFWQHQLDIDPEQRLHKSHELFWIWLSKSWFVTAAVALAPHLFGTTAMDPSTLLMWCDIGSFRGVRYNGKLLLQHPEVVPDDNRTVLWMAHRTPNPPATALWNDKLSKTEKRHFYHSGSSAVASAAAWQRFHRHFVGTLQRYAVANMFVGEDQCVLQSTCLLHPESCAYVPADQVPDNHYFGLRHVVHFGRGDDVTLWRPPPPPAVTTTTKQS
jgi:hypothetical protein